MSSDPTVPNLIVPPCTVPWMGTVQGGTIKFGTVGSEDITYSGSVSGSSMSGTWQIKGAGGAAGGGPWSASRS